MSEKVKSGEEFFKEAQSLEGKSALEISQALIDAWFSGREYGYREAKNLYKEVWHVGA